MFRRRSHRTGRTHNAGIHIHTKVATLDEGSSVVLDAMETKPTFSGVVWRPRCHGAPQWLPPGPTERGTACRHGEITKEGRIRETCADSALCGLSKCLSI